MRYMVVNKLLYVGVRGGVGATPGYERESVSDVYVRSIQLKYNTAFV